MAAGALRTVKSAVSRRRQAEDCHDHGGNDDTAASAFTPQKRRRRQRGFLFIVSGIGQCDAKHRLIKQISSRSR